MTATIVPDDRRYVTALREAQRERWSKVSADQRKKCLDHLRQAVPVLVVKQWAAEKRSGGYVGAGNPWFHFRAGMAVRNCLREVMKDEELSKLGDDLAARKEQLEKQVEHAS